MHREMVEDAANIDSEKEDEEGRKLEASAKTTDDHKMEKPWRKPHSRTTRRSRTADTGRESVSDEADGPTARGGRGCAPKRTHRKRRGEISGAAEEEEEDAGEEHEQRGTRGGVETRGQPA